MDRLIVLPAVVFVMTAFLAGCEPVSSHKATREWQAPDAEPKYNNILVMVEDPDIAVRRLLENLSAEEVQRKGIKASPTYPIVPDLNNPQIEQTLQDTEHDGLLVFRVVNMLGYDARSWEAIRTVAWLAGGVEGSYEVDRVKGMHRAESADFDVEVSLWDIATAKPVWSAVYKSWVAPERQDDPAEIQQFVEQVALTLENNGLIE